MCGFAGAEDFLSLNYTAAPQRAGPWAPKLQDRAGEAADFLADLLFRNPQKLIKCPLSFRRLRHA